MTSHLIPIAAALFLSALLVSSAGGQVAAKDVLADGIFPAGDGFARLSAISENIIRVTYAKDKAFFKHPSFAVIAQQGIPVKDGFRGTVTTVSGGMAVCTAGKIAARLAYSTGQVSFVDAATQQVILAEGSRKLAPATVQGETTNHVSQTWQENPGEALYGLGQHQFGLVDIKNHDIDLWQHNTEFAIPFLLSSKGFGIFWDNPSYTKFGDTREFEAIPPDHIFDANGQAGGFMATPYSGSNWGLWELGTAGIPRVDHAIAAGNAEGMGATPTGGARRGGPQESAIRWEGDIRADVDGLYKFKLYANGGYKMWIDGQLVADHWRQNWLPWDDLANATFKGGSKHKIVVEWIKDGGSYCSLAWKPPTTGKDAVKGGTTALWSEVGGGIDYYFIWGGGETPGALDKVLAGYRQLTGKAPMMPQWAFGLWQSRERYETQQASLDAVKGFRDRKIPFDNIVQDWMYWQESAWGSHEFDPGRFPDPDQWVKDLHAMNAHLMISVWGKFYPGTSNYNALSAKGYLYPTYPVKDWVGHGYPYTFYDTFNPDARDMFWDQVNKKLFSKGVDAWWMDATEPDLVQPSPPTLEKLQAGMPKTAAGTGASVLNAYPLLNSQGVYEGQRTAASDQRVFILTRAGFAGQQRYGTAVWSGDISSTWTAMKKQIAAGLGTSISGIPYWTMDSGGFAVPSKFTGRATGEALSEWRELNTRWLQFAAFVPIFRVHGQAPAREMWQFGGEMSDAYRAQKKIDRLRYRLLPFWYSLAGAVTQQDATFMRPLVMEFPNDPVAREIDDQYLLGSGVMVSPVTSYKARLRSVYLPGFADPSAARWYDFWTGAPAVQLVDPAAEKPAGPNWLLASAPYDQIPLHVRAGTILPLGPELQYTMEKPADPLTLLVYTGTDGDFSLYEDDGLTYQYEKSAFTRIPLQWNQKTKTLTIGKREGAFRGMLNDRTIRVIFIAPEKPVPFMFDMKADQTVAYHGDAIDVRP